MPMSRAVERLLFAVSLAAAAMPFGFGLIRAVATGGRDLRYVWVALAAAGGATLVAWLGRSRERHRGPLAGAAAIFVIATMTAMIMAILLGTRISVGALIVASSFAFCFAAAYFVRATR